MSHRLCYQFRANEVRRYPRKTVRRLQGNVMTGTRYQFRIPQVRSAARVIAVFLLMQGWVAVFADALSERHYWNPLEQRFEHEARSGNGGMPWVNPLGDTLARSGDDSPRQSVCPIPDYVAHLASDDPSSVLVQSVPIVPTDTVALVPEPRTSSSCLRFAPKASPPASPFFA